jgi:hypothetical protein
MLERIARYFHDQFAPAARDWALAELRGLKWPITLVVLLMICFRFGSALAIFG